MDVTHDIAIGFVRGIGPYIGKKLIAEFEGSSGIFAAKKSDLFGILGLVGNEIYDNLRNPAVFNDARRELRFIQNRGIEIISFENPKYPSRLKECPDSPLLLYQKGHTQMEDRKIISVVGTRNATDYGIKVCNQIVQDLQYLDPVIISGLASGIDGVAHRAALNAGMDTVAVLGHGLSMVYPQEHWDLARLIGEKGSLMTEFTYATAPISPNFPKRNRLIAGLADLTLVIEAAESGGALITARLANDYHRDVAAIPGHLFQKYSRGCNELIKTNKAALVESAEDIALLMNWSVKQTQSGYPTALPELAEEELTIVNALIQHGNMGHQEIIGENPKDIGRVTKILLDLELKGVIVSLPGKKYKLSHEFLNV